MYECKNVPRYCPRKRNWMEMRSFKSGEGCMKFNSNKLMGVLTVTFTTMCSFAVVSDALKLNVADFKRRTSA